MLIILTPEVCFCVDSFLTYKIVVIYLDYFCRWKYTNSTRVKRKSVYFFEIIGLYKNDSVVAKKIVPNSIKNYVFSGGEKIHPKGTKKTNNVVLKKTFSVVIFQVEISRSMTYFSCYWSPKFFLKFHLNLTQWAIFPFKQRISSNENCFVWEKWLNRINDSIYINKYSNIDKQIFKKVKYKFPLLKLHNFSSNDLNITSIRNHNEL